MLPQNQDELGVAQLESYHNHNILFRVTKQIHTWVNLYQNNLKVILKALRRKLIKEQQTSILFDVYVV